MGYWNVRDCFFLDFSMRTIRLALIFGRECFFSSFPVPLLQQNQFYYIFIMSHRTSPINFYLNYKFYNVRNFHIHAINHFKKIYIKLSEILRVWVCLYVAIAFHHISRFSSEIHCTTRYDVSDIMPEQFSQPKRKKNQNAVSFDSVQLVRTRPNHYNASEISHFFLNGHV